MASMMRNRKKNNMKKANRKARKLRQSNGGARDITASKSGRTAHGIPGKRVRGKRTPEGRARIEGDVWT